MGQYLIPANSKRGNLIFGMFRGVDLIVLLCGMGVTFIALVTLPLENTLFAVLALMPLIICATLVMPMNYYHNVLNVLVEMYEFITGRQKFEWKGWCWKDGIK